MHADNYRYSIAALILSVSLLTAWGVWFFCGKISLFKTSKKAYMTKGESVTSTFPAGSVRAVKTLTRNAVAEFDREAVGSIRPGQNAVLVISKGAGAPQVSIPASVVETSENPKAGNVQVKLEARLDDEKQKIPDGTACLVRVEIGRTTPAVMALQASGISGDAVSSGSPVAKH